MITDGYAVAMITAEMMYHLYDFDFRLDKADVEAMFRRMKDISEYSLSHSDIYFHHEYPELLALAMFFGMSSDDRYRCNRERLALLSDETLRYQGRAENIEKVIKERGNG